LAAQPGTLIKTMKLLCLDFSNLIVRHASNPYGTHKDALGRPVWGAVGALTQALRLIETHAPTHLLIARDGKRDDSFRREILPSYKAHRADPDEDITRNFVLAYEAVELFGWPSIHVERHEADDVIASACAQFPERCEIITGDKDLLALCSARVIVYLFRPGGPEAIDASGCKRIMGVEPRAVRDYKALVGDASDGIPGIAGIGPKSALKLLEHYHSLANMYKRVDEEGDDLRVAATAAIAAKVIAGRASARLSWQLAGLISTLPIDVDSLLLPEMPTWDKHGHALAELGLQGLAKALGVKAPVQPVTVEHAFAQMQSRKN
jgi:5'-3' exonuclease